MRIQMSKSTEGAPSFIQESNSYTMIQTLDVERTNAFLEIRFRELISVIAATVEKH